MPESNLVADRSDRGLIRAWLVVGSNSRVVRSIASKTTDNFSHVVGERVVWLVFDNEAQHARRWQPVMSISASIGCTSQTLNEWVRKTELDSGGRAGVPPGMAEKTEALEGESCWRHQANEILRKASAHLAIAGLDRRPK